MATYQGILRRLRSELPEGVKLSTEAQADKSDRTTYVVWDSSHNGATYWKGELKNIDVHIGPHTHLVLTNEEKEVFSYEVTVATRRT